jgi:ParB-like chromosome segregation protein Spo0J
LDHQALCLNHFLSRCYERLENLEPRGRKFSAESVDLASMRAFIEECSRKALDISLQSQNLTNLQRGRLLDILLWAGELFLLLRAPRLTLAQSIASSEAALTEYALPSAALPTRAASPNF